MGIARDPHDVARFPIYASRALLMRIENDRQKALRAALDDNSIVDLKKYCGYFAPDDIAPPAPHLSEDERNLIEERQRAIRYFEERGSKETEAQGNVGDRIFVRF